jgi:hypothetical protein
MPLPHTALVQTLGDPAQLQPGSVSQVAEHPSSMAVGPVFLSGDTPSSHCLPSSTLPLPQIGVQGFPGTGHCHPVSMAWQFPEQPSPLTVLLSSQASSDVSNPFPHTAMFLQGCPGVEQTQFASS